VAVGRTYLLPPLSSGGASLVRPWRRFHTPLVYETTRRRAEALEQSRKPQPTQTEWAIGCLEWLAEQNKSS
jgi:hypothetical protein